MNLAEWLRWHLTPAYICHSLDRSLYYIVWGDRRARHWLSVEAIPGPVPEEKKHGDLDGYVQTNHKDGRVWHRQTLPFAFWSVKSAHNQDVIDKKSDLFQDYVAFERWKL